MDDDRHGSVSWAIFELIITAVVTAAITEFVMDESHVRGWRESSETSWVASGSG